MRSRRACRQESAAATSGAGDRRRRRWTPLHRELGERPPAREGRGADHRRQPSTHTRCTTPGGGGDGPGEGSATHARARADAWCRRRSAAQRRRRPAHGSPPVRLLAPQIRCASPSLERRTATCATPAALQRVLGRAAAGAAGFSSPLASTSAAARCDRAARTCASTAEAKAGAARAAPPTRRARWWRPSGGRALASRNPRRRRRRGRLRRRRPRATLSRAAREEAGRPAEPGRRRPRSGTAARRRR